MTRYQDIPASYSFYFSN